MDGETCRRNVSAISLSLAEFASGTATHTSSRIQPAATAIAFEVLGLLVRDEKLEVLEVALA